MEPGDHAIAVECDIVAKSRGELRIRLDSVEGPVELAGNGAHMDKVGYVGFNARWRIEAGEARTIGKLGHGILLRFCVFCMQD